MKVQELSPEQKAELQKRYKEAGLKGPIHIMTVEKVEAKIAAALTNGAGNEPDVEAKENTPETEETEIKTNEDIPEEEIPFNFDCDVFKTVTKKNEEGREYQAQVPQELIFNPADDLSVILGGKIPAGQSFQYPKNSFIIKIESEQFIISAELAAKIFKLKG